MNTLMHRLLLLFCLCLFAPCAQAYYEPGSGRFLSPDPFGHEASMSLYDYAGGDPVNYVDPDGRLVRGGNDASGKFTTGMWNLAKDGYYSASYGVSRMVYGQEAADAWYGENWQGLKNAAGGLAQTLYDFSATTTYAGWSMLDNNFAYNSWGGSVGRTGSFMDALRGGDDQTGAYQIGHGGLNAFLMMLPLKMGNTARASEVSLADAQAAMTQMGAAKTAPNTTRLGITRNNPADWRATRDLWDNTGYGDILSDANRAAIARGRTPVVDSSWVRNFPEDAGLLGERIPMHHIQGTPITVPLPATRHLDAHMPGGFRYNPGGPGSALPVYPAPNP
jgi:hypothetical protein